MRGKQSGSGVMEEPCRAFDTKPSTTALESEPVSETDVSQCGVNDSSGDRSVAATVSQVGLEDVTSGPMVIGEPGADLSGIDMVTDSCRTGSGQ